jgi:hypothetical protein
MFKVIVAHSEHVDTELALSHLLEQCHTQLDGKFPGAAILFSALQLDFPTLLDGLGKAWEGLPLIGCTTDGELSSCKGFDEDSVTLTLFCSDTVTFTAGLGRNISDDPKQSCQQAIKQAGFNKEGDSKLCITTPESLTASGHQLLETLKGELGSGVPVVGGTSADYWEFNTSRQFFGTEVVSNAIPILLFSGDLDISIGVESGWQPIGDTGEVTQSSNSVVQQIDNKPALAFYQRFLGKHAQPTGDRPLAIVDDNAKILMLRAPASVDEKGAIEFFSDVEVGSKVKLTVADRTRVLHGSRLSVQSALSGFPKGKQPEAGLFFSCAGRKVVLGSRTTEEFDIIKEELPAGIPFSGFYCYGEIGPVNQGSNNSLFHNETFVSVLLGSGDNSPSNNIPFEKTPDKAKAVSELDEEKAKNKILEARLHRLQKHRIQSEQLKDQTDSLYQNVIKELEETNKIILDSIRYASKIQRATLPDNDALDRVFKELFVLWEPRDLVGGDIYWYRPWGDGHLIVLGDCTGHGVPGAFMTLITGGALDRAIKYIPQGETKALMNRMHRFVQEVLAQDQEEGESDDGMELGMVYVNKQKDEITFTGARFQLFMLQDGVVKEVKGARKGIGYRGIPSDQEYQANTIPIVPNVDYFMTTDGFIDQIGGIKNRSFGKKRFVQLIQSLASWPMAVQQERFRDALKEFQGPHIRRDDVAVIGFRF